MIQVLIEPLLPVLKWLESDKEDIPHNVGLKNTITIHYVKPFLCNTYNRSKLLYGKEI